MTNSPQNAILFILAAGANIRYSQRTDDGSWEMVFDNQMTALFTTKLGKLYTESFACLVNEEHEKDLMEEFATGGGLMTIHRLHAAEQYLSQMGSYYILPVPKLLPTDNYSTTRHSDITLFAISYTAVHENKLFATTATMELMAEESIDQIRGTYYESLLKKSVFFTESKEREEKMIDDICNSVYYDFALLHAEQIGKPTNMPVTDFFRRLCTSGDTLAHKRAAMQSAWSVGLVDLLEDIHPNICY